MTIARLASGFGVIICFAACGRALEPSAPSASATSASAAEPPSPAEAKPESAVAPAPAPRPAGGPQGLDQPKSELDEDQAEFTNLEAAERALNQAKADLDRLALAEPAPSVGRNATADRAAEKKKDTKSATRAPSAAGAAAPTKSNAVCEDACRAFSSLTRAANAVCRLDGSSGTHCTRAKHVLADAQQRVASCSCSAASD